MLRVRRIEAVSVVSETIEKLLRREEDEKSCEGVAQNA